MYTFNNLALYFVCVCVCVLRLLYHIFFFAQHPHTHTPMFAKQTTSLWIQIAWGNRSIDVCNAYTKTHKHNISINTKFHIIFCLAFYTRCFCMKTSGRHHCHRCRCRHRRCHRAKLSLFNMRTSEEFGWRAGVPHFKGSSYNVIRWNDRLHEKIR